jgi:hypothetical protein
MNWLRSCGKENGVNDVIQRIESNYRRDSGDDAGSGGRSNSRGAPFDGEAPVTGDPADEQPKQKTFQDTGDYVTDEKGVANEIEKINERDAEISAGD